MSAPEETRTMPVDPLAAAPMLSGPIRERIREYLPRYPSKRAVTLPALHIVHEHLRCVPYQAMVEIAERASAASRARRRKPARADRSTASHGAA